MATASQSALLCRAGMLEQLLRGGVGLRPGGGAGSEAEGGGEGRSCGGGDHLYLPLLPDSDPGTQLSSRTLCPVSQEFSEPASSNMRLASLPLKLSS